MLIQLIMVGLLIAFPSIVTGSITKEALLDRSAAEAILNNADQANSSSETNKPPSAEDDGGAALLKEMTGTQK